MNIHISTVKREKDFINPLINSIRTETADPITLFVGGDDDSYLANVPFPKQKVDERGLENIRKAAKGYYSCLTFDRNTDCLIVEDDVVFKPGWHEMFQTFKKTVKDKYYIISFINPFVYSIPEPNIDVPSLQEYQYKVNLMWGEDGEEPNTSVVTWVNTSAVFYPKEVLQTELPEFIYRYGVRGNAVYDLAAGFYLFRTRIPIYLIHPPMVENLGNEYSRMGHPELRQHDDYTSWGKFYVNR